jgi:hypothetical protein
MGRPALSDPSGTPRQSSRAVIALMTRSLSTSFPAALPDRAASAGRTIRYLAATLVLVALTLSPLLWAAVPPLVDYPNHLARMWILVHGGALPDLASNYVVQWRLVPNLGMDLVIPVLAQVMPVEIAGRLFIALTMLGLVVGTMTLHRALHGRLGFWPLSSLLFIYNAALYWGFLNSLLGSSLFLLAFSGWIATRRWPVAPRIAVFAVLASLLLVVHLFAFGLYALTVGSYEVGNRLQERNLSIRGFLSLCVTGLQFVPGMALWLASLGNIGSSYTNYGDFAAKAYALQSPFTFGSAAVAFDKAILIFSLGFLIAAILARALRLAPEMRLPLAAMVLASVAMPTWANGSWLGDIRLPVTLPFIIIAATRLEPGRLRGIGLFAAMAAALLGIRVWAVSESWRDHEREFAEFRTAARAIAPGARLLIVETPMSDAERAIGTVPDTLATRSEPDYWHMPALAVIDRSVFIPYLFTGSTPVLPARRNAGVFQMVGTPLAPEALERDALGNVRDPGPDLYGELPYWRDWQRDFDYLLWIDFGRHYSTLPPDLIEEVAGGSFFRIYRVNKP